MDPTTSLVKDMGDLFSAAKAFDFFDDQERERLTSIYIKFNSTTSMGKRA